MHYMDTNQDLRRILRFLFTMSIIINFAIYGKSELFDEHCNGENNSTLICNYVPKAVPKQYIHVRIVNFKRNDQSVVLYNTGFADESWLHVQSLEFNDKTGWNLSCIFKRECFKGLSMLRELNIHMSSFLFDPGVFIGLPLVHTLDLSACHRYVVEDLAEQLKVPNTLPSLQKLILSEVGSYDTRNRITLSFVESLLPRNVTLLDLSKTQIPFANVTALVKTVKTLEFVNLSYSNIGDTWTPNITQEDLLRLKNVDVSNTILPAKIIPRIPMQFVIANQTVKYSELRNSGIVKNLFTPLVINASRVNRDCSVWFYNTTLIFDEQLHWKVKQLIIRRNNIRYLDVVVKCPEFKLTSLVHLDLSDNGLQFFQPVVCAPNLEIVDLSRNELFRMVEKNSDLFEELGIAQTKLRIVNLSRNQLPMVPTNLFKNNKNLEIIDLSFNNIEQLNLELENLHRLRVLDVSYNNIKLLDETSINSLKGIPCVKSPMSVENLCSIDLRSNPIICSTCGSKPFIKWLVSSQSISVDVQGLTCTSEDGKHVKVDDSVVRQVQSICNRRIIIICSIVSTCVTSLAICMIVTFVYRRKRRARKKRKRETAINKLIEGEGQYEFVTFLSYNNQDDQFVEENVIDQLNENLHLMTGIDRNLVCTGDRHFCPGFMVHDEILNLLDRASVIIFVVSNNFCDSAYCKNEFDQAYMQGKPIVLMLMEYVGENQMLPAMRQLYKRDARILWTLENGQYTLKTTWENVCRSLLDKVQV